MRNIRLAAQTGRDRSSTKSSAKSGARPRSSIRHRVLNEAPQDFAGDRPTAGAALHVRGDQTQFLPVVEVAVENDGVDSLRVANVFQRIGIE